MCVSFYYNDGCTKLIPAYRLSKDITTSIVTNTIDVLRKNPIYQLHPDALFHSNQGVQYTSLILKEELRKRKITQSMSRCGNYQDNAPQESFYGHTKDELHLE